MLVTKSEQSRPSDASVNEVDRDRFARLARVSVGQKVVDTPSYWTRISSYSELSLFMQQERL